jgi:hypothetical protein
MAESKTAERERTERNVDQTFQRAEDAFGTMFDNSRRAFQAMLEYNRNNINTSYQMMRDMQDESIRFTDAFFDNLTRLQKNNVKSMENFAQQFQTYTEKVVKENQSRMEESIDQGLELVTPGGAGVRAGRR